MQGVSSLLQLKGLETGILHMVFCCVGVSYYSKLASVLQTHGHQLRLMNWIGTVLVL